MRLFKRREPKFRHPCPVCRKAGYQHEHGGRWGVPSLHPPASVPPLTSMPMPPAPGAGKPTGSTRPGDLRYNLMVRLGNLGCPHDVDGLDTEDLRAHWRGHLHPDSAHGRL